MAQELQENKPCPVCGSLHHPAPAVQSSSESTDAAQLSALREELEQLQTDYRQYLQTFSHAQAVLDEKTNQLKTALEVCQEIPTDYEHLQIQIKGTSRAGTEIRSIDCNTKNQKNVCRNYQMNNPV